MRVDACVDYAYVFVLVVDYACVCTYVCARVRSRVWSCVCFLHSCVCSYVCMLAYERECIRVWARFCMLNSVCVCAFVWCKFVHVCMQT